MAIGVWLLTGLSLVGVVFNIKKSNVCFLIWLFTNASWAVINFKRGFPEQGVLFCVYFALSAWGLFKWTTQEKKQKEKSKMKKGCMNCLYSGTFEKCGTGTSDCLGSIEEVRNNNGKYLYRNWEAGNGIARLRKFEAEGERNIVIGGMGKAEVNTKWTPEESLKNLCCVSEQCGYLTQKGLWTPGRKEIIVYNETGQWVITYIEDIYLSLKPRKKQAVA